MRRYSINERDIGRGKVLIVAEDRHTGARMERKAPKGVAEAVAARMLASLRKQS